MFRIQFHRKNQESGFVSLNLQNGKRTFSVELLPNWKFRSVLTDLQLLSNPNFSVAY
jgi:hypothetical protein